ncbi:MAG: glycerophosphodiester phosphodiesterase [Halobacteriaceae archaeon]
MSADRAARLGEPATGGREPTHVAHRGHALDAAENTLPAVRAAADIADAVEVDVRRCADDVVVVHDETVDRVTDATGPVADFTAEELAALDVCDSGAGVPRFADVARAVPPDVGLQVELKERGLVADVVEALAAAGRLDPGEDGRGATRSATAGGDLPPPAVLSSFDHGALREARETAPALPRSLIFDSRPTRALRVAVDLDCVAVHPPVALCLGSGIPVPGVGRVALPASIRRRVPDSGRTAGRRLRDGARLVRAAGRRLPVAGDRLPTHRVAGLDPLVGDSLLAAARERDLAVNAWTVTDEAVAAALHATGVDGLSVDGAAVVDPE